MTIRRFLLAVGAAAAAAGAGRAQTNWLPTAPGPFTYNLGTNWSTGTVPTSGTVNITSDLTGDQTITLDGVTPNLTALNIGDSALTPATGGVFNGYTVGAGAGGRVEFAAGGATLTSRGGANVISAGVFLNGPATVTHTNTVGSLTLSGTVTLNGNTLTVGATGSSLGRVDRGVVISGQITGAGALGKTTGGNFLVLTNPANDYAGPTTISSGAVRLANGGVLGGGNLVLSGGQLFPEGTFTRALGDRTGEVQLTTGNSGFGAIGQDVTVNFGGAGAEVTWGTPAFNPGRFVLSSTSSDRTVTVENGIDLAGTSATDREVSVEAGGAAVDAVLRGAIRGAARLTKAGNGRVELPTANPGFTGVFQIGGEGPVRVSNAGALGTTAGVTLVRGEGRANVLELDAGITLAEPIQIEGRTAVTNLNPAVASVGGNNVLTGGIAFNGGGLEYTVGVNAGAGLEVRGNVTSGQGTGTMVRNLNLRGAGAGTVTGVISNGGTNDPVAVVKRDAGTWTLAGTGPQTYTGATTVLAGRLQVDGTLSAAAAAVTVNGGTLAGARGTINRPVAVTAGAFAPGVSDPGTGTPAVGAQTVFGPLTVANDGGVTFQSGAAYVFAANGTAFDATAANFRYGRLVVQGGGAGTVSLNGATLAGLFGAGFAPTSADFLGVIDNQTANAVAGTFAGVPQDGLATLGGYDFLVSYVGSITPAGVSRTGGNDVVFYGFTPVPEPASVVGVAAAAAAGVGLVRRRVRRAG